MNAKFKRRVTYVHGLWEEMQVMGLGLIGCEDIQECLLYYAL